MKRNLFILAVFSVLTSAVFAAAYDPVSKVPSIAQKILQGNGITAQVKFETTSKAVDNSSFSIDRTVSISKEDLSYAKNDNETASVIANELGHIIAGHASRGKVISSITGQDSINTSNATANSIVESYTSTKKEKEADVISVNLLANAGYNPLAAIVVLTRQTQTAWNAIMGKPANADRAMNIYDYTGYAYPNKLKAGYNCNEYKNFLAYANTVLAERKDNKKAQKKLDKELAKYRKNSVSQVSKFKTRGAMSGWDAAYGILNGTN